MEVFFKYTVVFYAEDEDYKRVEESGYTTAPSYTEACEKVSKFYGDDNLGYIHLVALNDHCVITEKDFKDAINAKI